MLILLKYMVLLLCHTYIHTVQCEAFSLQTYSGAIKSERKA